MSAASIYLEILKGGPFDGLPALSIRFEEEESELEIGPALKILSEMNPPPMHLRIVHAAGLEDLEPLQRLLNLANSYGMAISLEIYGGFFPWMLSNAIGWRTLHTTDLCVPNPVDEIIFHTETIPIFEPYPFHAIKRPLLWWAPPFVPLFETIPQNMRLWLPRKSVEKKLFPPEDE